MTCSAAPLPYRRSAISHLPRRSPLLLLILLVAATVAAATKSVSVDLELAPPKPMRPDSSRGFPSLVRLFDPVELPQSRIPFLSRALQLFGRSSEQPQFTSRMVTVDLLGGITRVGEYYTQIRIGGQRIRVQADTGSSTLALPVAECDRCLPSDQRYNAKLSKTGKARWISCTNKLCKPDVCASHKCGVCSASDACCADENPSACGFILKYGDGSLARGALMVDEMSWGDNVTAPVIFGGILHDSVDFERPIVDGILGLSYKALACNPTCVEPPFQQMVKAGVVEDSFSICMTGQGGKLVLGAFDPKLASSEMTYVPLALSDPPTYYTVNISSTVAVGERNLQLPNFRAGIVDSGTTLVVVSKDTFLLMLEHMTTYHCDLPGLCDTEKPWFMPSACVKMPDDIVARLPTFVFHLGSNGEFELELRPEDYMLKYHKVGVGSYRCLGFMAMPSMQKGTDIILGNTVMQRYVTHYDRKNKQMGFAEATEGCGGGTRCSAFTSCTECAGEALCSFNFQTKTCQEAHSGLGLVPYPECSGGWCMCRFGAQTGFVFGTVAGMGGSLIFFAVGMVVLALYSSRRSRLSVPSLGPEEATYSLVGDDDDDFDMEQSLAGPGSNKTHIPLPSS